MGVCQDCHGTTETEQVNMIRVVCICILFFVSCRSTKQVETQNVQQQIIVAPDIASVFWEPFKDTTADIIVDERANLRRRFSIPPQ